jgi:hypothetical protein
MKQGSLVRSNGSMDPLYHKIQIHGMIVSDFRDNDVGIIIDSAYSTTDIPYIEILASGGKRGWIRYEHVEVLQV